MVKWRETYLERWRDTRNQMAEGLTIARDSTEKQRPIGFENKSSKQKRNEKEAHLE
jgi:hypothetical protein